VVDVALDEGTEAPIPVYARDFGFRHIPWRVATDALDFAPETSPA
jgi:hypothetical protein